jgi:hypothetical protein
MPINLFCFGFAGLACVITATTRSLSVSIPASVSTADAFSLTQAGFAEDILSFLQLRLYFHSYFNFLLFSLLFLLGGRDAFCANETISQN